MSKVSTFVFVLLCLTVCSLPGITSDLRYVPDELIVQFKTKPDGQQRSLSEKNQILNSLGGATIKRVSRYVPGLTLVKLPTGQTVEDALETFNKTDGILFAVPNHKLEYASTSPNDPCFPKLWGLHNTGQTGGTPDADIDAPEAWDISTRSNIIVAVLDTGVDYTHPDLAANMWTDSNGCHGYDFADDDNDPMDENGHGTMCAGIIGAVGNNSLGVTGVCWNVRIMALKIGDSAPDVFSAIEAIRYAIDEGASVLNASWGGEPNTLLLRYAIEDADANGLLFVACAQNNSPSCPYPDNDSTPIYPASYDLDNIIAVLATDAYDEKPSWSHYGATSVDLGAPGSGILSCVPGDDYESWDGTSMAAPYVAGACALVWSIKPSLSHLQVKDIVLNSVDHIPALDGLCVTGGRLNLFNALTNTIDLTLDKVDNIDEGNGVVPGGYITYTISYTNPIITDPCDPNYTGDVNDVVITDFLPCDLAFISASGPNSVYDPNTHTVTWNIGTLEPNESNSVTLTTKVNDCITVCSVIANSCKIEGKAKGGTWTRWAVSSENTPILCASNPNPTCGEISDFLCTGAPDLNLTWCPGYFAADTNGHEVYFGTNFNDVNDADNSWPLGEVYKGTVTNPSFPIPLNSLHVGTTYYWRIDEVNDSNIWRGSVWGFTTDCCLIDNFDEYKDLLAADMRKVWNDYSYNDTGMDIFPEWDPNHGTPGPNNWLMRCEYKNDLDPYYSEVTANTVNTGGPWPNWNGLGIDPDWEAMGAKVLSLWFYGGNNESDTATNDPNEQMYVKLTDGGGIIGRVDYPYMNDVTEEEWHQWNIVLQDFVDDNNVDLSNVKKITIGFDCDGTGENQSIEPNIVYFEDIRLYLGMRCFPGDYPVGDFKPDCIVDFYDFAVFAQAWLTSSGQPDYNPVCDIDISVSSKDKINEYDLARFCDYWLLQLGEETSMGDGFGGAFYAASPPCGEPAEPTQQPQIELQPEPELLQSEPELQPEPQPQMEQLEEVDIEEIKEAIEYLQMLLSDEQFKQMIIAGEGGEQGWQELEEILQDLLEKLKAQL